MNRDNNSLPVGSVGRVLILKPELNVYYGYSENSEIVNKVHNEEEHFVYKVIDGWFLIGNNQWVHNDNDDLIFEEITNTDIIIDSSPVKHDSFIKAKAVEDIQTVEDIEDAEIISETIDEQTDIELQLHETLNEDAKVEESQGIFKKIGRLFGKK